MIIERTNLQGITMRFSVDNSLHKILMGFKNAVENHKTSVVIILDGKSGLGKTTAGGMVAKVLDNNFDLHKMHYQAETFMKGGNGKVGLANAKKGDVIFFDESAPISNRSALSKLNKMVTQALTMIRSKEIYVIFCINSFFDLDKNISIYRADILLHCYGKHLYDRGHFCTFFKGLDGKDRLKLLYIFGKKMYDYSRPKANFVGKFSKFFVVDEEEYDRQKQEGVKAFLMGEQTDYINDLRNKLIIHVIKNKLMDVKEVSEVIGLSTRQIYNIVQKGGKREYEKEFN